jgi:hypothetical protein
VRYGYKASILSTAAGASRVTITNTIIKQRHVILSIYWAPSLLFKRVSVLREREGHISTDIKDYPLFSVKPSINEGSHL